ncbi:hypothetical protein [Sphingomonas bacterium]|uniref:hypothetical protein n=1 Tax=Sphingomonas bacterium TaxID=1895847 RepID=UPI001576A7F2|nr:hypothetical protein [Sphingomonas bacterium]
MTKKLRSIVAALLILLTALPPIIHLTLGDAIKAKQNRDAVQSIKELERLSDSMH